MTDFDSGSTRYGHESAEDQVFIAGDIVMAARDIDPEAIVAGGWARDLFFEIESKDIDLWLHTHRDPDDVVAAMRYALGSEFVALTVLVSDHGEHWTKWLVKATYKGAKVDVINFHTRVGENGQNVLARFDFGLCKASWQPETGLWLHADFVSDYNNKTLTYRDEARDDEDVPRAVYDHLPRLQAKFPGYVPTNIPDVPKPEGKRLTTFRVATGWWGGAY